MATVPLRGTFVPDEAFRPDMLPTAMRRVLEVAMGSPLVAGPAGDG
jgi:hypothetical protein